MKRLSVTLSVFVVAIILLLKLDTNLPAELVSAGGSPLPYKTYLDVPFSPQAPFGDWGEPYQEACEEMSVIMSDYYIRNLPLSREQANRELHQIINWERSNGYTQDVTIEELADIVQNYYGYNVRISHDVSVASIVTEVSAGHPVIVPAAGRKLGNPYFSGEGPWYHMLLITGYNTRDFITNDPGTKRGEGYKYDHQTLINAVHNWTGVKEEIENGQKVMLVIE